MHQVASQAAALYLARLRALASDGEGDLVRSGLGGADKGEVTGGAARHILEQQPGAGCPFLARQGRDLGQAAVIGQAR